MEKFCKYCGAQLNDGQICACQSSNTQPTLKPQATATAVPNQPNAAINYLKKLGILTIGLIKKPVTAGLEHVLSYDVHMAFGLIGLQALAVALLMATLTGKINSAISGLLSEAKFPLFTILLVGAATTYAIACLIPAILLMLTKLFKGSTSYKSMLCASAVNSVMTIPFILAGALISLLMPISLSLYTIADPMSLVGPFIWPVGIAVAGIPLGNYAMLKIMQAGNSLKEDKSVYVIFLTGIVSAITLVILVQLVYPLCLPQIVKSGLNAAEGAMDLLSF